MNLRIEQASEEGRVVWRVHACDMTFTFADETSAVTFAAKLEERVDAPHELSAETVERLAAEHFQMLRGS